MNQRHAVGLPSGPGRARTLTRPRNEPDHQPSLPRQVRPQKSVSSLPHERGITSVPRNRSHFPSQSSNSEAHSYRASNDSASSTSSRSMFDHVRSESGYTSSATSYDDEDHGYPTSKSSASQSLRTRHITKESVSQDAGDTSTDATGGVGSTLWNRVAVAAGALTVNVSKAWTSNIVTLSGEETPPGHESRLTRAMKAYHLTKARDRSDLPAWLFEEHERTTMKSSAVEVSAPPGNVSSAHKPRGLRDIYDSAASTSIPSSRKPEQSMRYNGYDSQPFKATDRLKAIRDAKRTALQTQTPNNHRDDGLAHGRSDEQRFGGRIGLPSRPATPSRTRRHNQ